MSILLLILVEMLFCTVHRSLISLLYPAFVFHTEPYSLRLVVENQQRTQGSVGSKMPLCLTKQEKL